ncbi:MAG: hypothetical protein HKO65_07625 [Gemmatimonadetes bacterium]|nr:hypothetical protein [Gemmatimonadota bacterium]NNM04959.1 hypothetical protein [Gemmatimonadota bacterium]
MADHLAALGIGSSSAEERQDQVRQILKGSQPHSQRADSMTLRWHDPSGAELWIYVDQSGTMKSVQPHFSGGPRIRLEIQAILERAEVSPYDGGFLGLTQEGGSNPSLGGGFPIVFDAPDFPDVKDVILTAKHEVELAGFAVELNVYPTEEEFREAQPDLKPLGIPAFIPAGMMAQMEGGQPTAHALMVGRTLDAKRVTNELTKREFIRLQMETPAGPMDLIVDPGLLDELPANGQIVQTGAWLSGRIAPEDDEKTGSPAKGDQR